MLAVVAGVVAYCGWQGAFVPPPAGRHVPMATAAGAAVMLGTAPAYADKIDDAAKVLSEKSYPFLKDSWA